MKLQNKDPSGRKQGPTVEKSEEDEAASPGLQGEELDHAAAGSSPSVTSMPCQQQQLHSNEHSPEAQVLQAPAQPSMLEFAPAYKCVAPGNQYSFHHGSVASPIGQPIPALEVHHTQPRAAEARGEAQAIASPVASAASPTHYAMSSLPCPPGWATMASPVQARQPSQEQTDVTYLQRHASTPSVVGSDGTLARYPSMPILQHTPSSPYPPPSSRQHTPVAGQAPYALYHHSTTPTTPVDPGVHAPMRYYPEQQHQQPHHGQHSGSQY